MTAFATIGDLEKRLGEEISPGLVEATNTNLEDAAVYIRIILADHGKTPESLPKDNLLIVNCNLTLRWYSNRNSQVPEGATSASTSVGDFSQSLAFSGGISSRSFWLTDTDRRLLGIRSKAGAIYMGGKPWK